MTKRKRKSPEFLHEGIRKCKLSVFDVRLWIAECKIDDIYPTQGHFYEHVVSEICQRFHDNEIFLNGAGFGARDLAIRLMRAYDCLNAIEVTHEGQGDIIYRNWP
jgi:hypothetical protein